MYKVRAKREGREERRRDTEGPISQAKQEKSLEVRGNYVSRDLLRCGIFPLLVI